MVGACQGRGRGVGVGGWGLGGGGAGGGGTEFLPNTIGELAHREAELAERRCRRVAHRPGLVDRRVDLAPEIRLDGEPLEESREDLRRAQKKEAGNRDEESGVSL